MSDLLSKLAVGDMRTIGAANEIAEMALHGNSVVETLIDGLANDHPGVRMRSADALEKIGLKQPGLIEPYKTALLQVAGQSGQQEVQWHMAQLMSYLSLNEAEAAEVSGILLRYYRESKSNIVRVMSIASLVKLATSDIAAIRPQVKSLLIEAAGETAPSIRGRAKKLLAKLDWT